MTDAQTEFHLAGDVIGSSPSQIAKALEPLATEKLRVTDEVEAYGEGFEVSIYPNQPGRFLIGGNLHLSHEASRTLVAQIAKRFDAHGIVYQLELSPEEGGADEVTRHPQFGVAPTPVTSRSMADRGAVILGDRVHSGTADEVRRGTQDGVPALITLTGTHATPHETLRDQLALRFDGIAPLLYCGPGEPGAPYPDMLIERLPDGHPVAQLAPLDPRVVARLGAAVATVAARVHAAGGLVGGLRPELIYVDEAGTFIALVPRGPAFIAGSPIARGMRSYHVPYMAPEQLFANTVAASSEIFSLCATLWFAAMGSHPFGDPHNVSEMAGRLLAGTPGPWTGSRELGDILARGLSIEPERRPTMHDLAATLARLVD